MNDRPTKRDITAAVNFLIQNPTAGTYIADMRKLLARWDTHPMRYDGQLKVLNALLDVGVESQRAFDLLVDHVHEKRKLLPAIKKTDYQQKLMAARRERTAKAIELRNLQRGSEMDSKTKAAYSKELTTSWAAARTKFIAERGKLTWAERNEAAAEFWAMIDRNLDLAIEAEKRKGLG